MRWFVRMGVVMAGLLVGLGVAVTAKTIREVGFDHLVLGHIVGPGLILAGIARLKLQRALDHRPGGGDGDGGAS